MKKSGEPLLRTQTLLSFILMYNLFSLILIKIIFFTIILVLVVILLDVTIKQSWDIIFPPDFGKY